jgi:hypothetical protein
VNGSGLSIGRGEWFQTAPSATLLVRVYFHFQVGVQLGHGYTLDHHGFMGVSYLTTKNLLISKIYPRDKAVVLEFGHGLGSCSSPSRSANPVEEQGHKPQESRITINRMVERV